MRSVLALGATLWVSACAPLPVVATGPDPADPGVPVRPPAYRPVLSGTVDHRPVEPKPWADVNRRVAPDGGRP